MSGPGIKLLPVEASDIPTLAKINDIGFADQVIDKLMFPKSDGGLLASHMLKIFKEDPTARFMKAVIDGQIVGFTQWHHYHDFPLPAEAEPLPNWGPDANGVLCDIFFGAMKRVRREHMAGKKCTGEYSYLLIRKETAKSGLSPFSSSDSGHCSGISGKRSWYSSSSRWITYGRPSRSTGVVRGVRKRT
jgi:hypothetical protein